jgi:hypothetical protein
VRFSLKDYEPQFRRCLFLIILYSIPAWLTLKSSAVVDPDVWLHLRAGQWIVQHRWVPYNDWFSNSGMGKPWAAFSWLSEVVIYGLFSRLGLIGLLVYVYGLMLAIAAALHSLVRKFESRLAYSVALTALALLALAPSYTPRPWLFTILFFIIELNVLVSVRRSGNYRALLLLPALFALWANFHIQFVYGLFVLGIATLEDPINRLLRHRGTVGDEETRPVPVRTMALITGACLVATMVNPYHARIYAVVFDIATSIGVYELLSELQPMQFRSIPDWLVLLLTLAAAFAFGRRRAINPFWGLLLLTGALVSFRSGRDAWFVVIIAVVIISNARSVAPIGDHYLLSKVEILIVVAAVGILLLPAARIAHLSEGNLQSIIARTYPADAARIVEERNYRGPLYNYFDWGSYLIWHLPKLPVAIDGRTDVHHADEVRQSLRVWNGEPEWASDPELAAAQTIIAQKNLPLTQLLRLDPRFEQVYEDQVAVVFIAKVR